MNKSDRIKLHDILQQFSRFNGNQFKVLAIDTKMDLTISLLEGYEIEDQQKNTFTPVIIQDEFGEDGGLCYLDKIHELLVLELEYKILKTERRTYHVYAGVSIKTYPGESGTCFLNFRDNEGVHVKGIPLNEILTVDYNDEQKLIVVTFVNKRPAFRYSWLKTSSEVGKS